ncbi:MAG: hypothetical protein IPK72_21120 [Candidatus Eisenbacteria bacterium]|nr:hypothetical protein [Candidatus Eisenbacteria bacterium]
MNNSDQTPRRGVRLIEPEETLSFKIDPELDTSFTYRRVPDHLKAQWSVECIKDMRTGELDTFVLFWRAIEYGLIGWSGVYDGHGREVPFSIENAKRLDTYILTELRDRINGARGFKESVSPLAAFGSM